MMRTMKNGYAKFDAFMTKHHNKIWVSVLFFVIALSVAYIYFEATRDVFTFTITN